MQRTQRKPVQANSLALLIMDDDGTQAKGLKERLDLAEPLSHVAIHVATDLREFRQRLRGKHYTAAVTDWHCPTAETGRAIVKDLKSQRGGSARGIAVLSGAVLDLQTEKELQENVLLLRKPLNGQYDELVRFLVDNLSSPSHQKRPSSSTEPGSDTEATIGVMFGSPFKLITCLTLALLVFSVAAMCLWLLTGVAIVHPLGPAIGVFGSLSLLLELYLGIRIARKERQHL